MRCCAQKLVGALTSKPFAFTARSWEVVMVPSVDTYDSFLGSIRLDFRNNDLLRVLPLINEGLNEEWLTDKARFSYDGLKRQRFLKPYVSLSGPYSRDGKHAETYFRSLAELKKSPTTQAVSVDYFMSSFSSMMASLNPRAVSVFYGKEVDLETALSAKLSLESRFQEVIYKNGDYSNVSKLDPDLLRFALDPASLLTASSLLLVGSNLRWELPLLNIKVMRRALQGLLSVFTVAVRSAFSYPVINLSANALDFVVKVVKGRARISLKGKDLFVILSYNLANYATAISLSSPFKVGVLFPWASTVTLLEASSSRLVSKMTCMEPSLALSVNSDAVELPDVGASVGLLSHGHNAHSQLDFVLPCSAYSESNSHFFNVFRNERYARFGYALSKNILPSWASLAKLFSLAELSSPTSLTNGYFSSVVSKPFENEDSDQSASYAGKFYTCYPSTFPKALLYEVTPNYYRSHYVSRSSKPTSLAAARFPLSLSNFVTK